MVIRSLVGLKNYLKKSKAEIEKEIVGVLRQASDRRKKTEKVKIVMINCSALILYLLARLRMILISVFIVIGCFQKSIFRRELI